MLDMPQVLPVLHELSTKLFLNHSCWGMILTQQHREAIEPLCLCACVSLFVVDSKGSRQSKDAEIRQVLGSHFLEPTSHFRALKTQAAESHFEIGDELANANPACNLLPELHASA